MSGQRVLAVDFGDRRTGVAVTDHTGTVILPLPAVLASADDECARSVIALATERETEVIVVGLPLDREGAVGPRAARTLKFVKVLKQLAPCDVVTVDETHTTDEAHERLKRGGLKASQRKKIADSVAAIVILERYQSSLGQGIDGERY